LPEIVLLSLESVVPNRRQSRAIFDPEKLQELANSIKEQGVLQPILVRRKGENNYEIIAGERRYRACKIVGLDKIPAIIKNADEMGSMIDSFLENAQREDLTPLEKENAIIDLWHAGKFETTRDLDRALGYGLGYCGTIIEARTFREKYGIPPSITTTTIVSTKGLADDIRQRLLQRVGKDEGKFGQVRTVRELKAIIEKAPSAIVERVLNEEVNIAEANRTIDLYNEANSNEILKSLASAVSEGKVSSDTAEGTLKLYSRLQREGVELDPEKVTNDVEEIKRQTALNAVHNKLIEEARVSVLTGQREAIDFKIQDPGENFIREVSDVAWKVQRWGVPNLMQVGSQRWKIASKYFREIEVKIRTLLGYSDIEPSR